MGYVSTVRLTMPKHYQIPPRRRVWTEEERKQRLASKIEPRRNSRSESLLESDCYRSSRSSIQTTSQGGCTKMFANDLNNFLETLWTKSRRALCSLCRRVTESRRLRRWHSQLGIWAVTLSTNLLVARIQVRLRWVFLARSVRFYVSLPTKRYSRRVWIRIVKALKRG